MIPGFAHPEEFLLELKYHNVCRLKIFKTCYFNFYYMMTFAMVINIHKYLIINMMWMKETFIIYYYYYYIFYIL